MPSSTYKIINQTVENVLKINPSSILDIGIGFGKYGFLCREYLECWNDRTFPNQWKVKIDGIEIFQKYADLSHNKNIYDNIFVNNVMEILSELPKYDLLIAMDVIEHLPKKDGEALLFLMAHRAQKAVMINVPTGNWLNNKVVSNNPHEAHQAIWIEEDLEKYGRQFRSYELFPWKQGSRGGCLGVFKK